MTSTNRLERALILFRRHRLDERAVQQRILEGHPELSEILEPMFEGARENAGPLDSEPPPGTAPNPPRIEGYALHRLLGSGGMGQVYLAHRAGFAGHPVALKVIDRDVVTHQVLKRFERERETLTKLHHPNIAAILDAGTTTEGHPYFVQEYVEGSARITEHCATHHIDWRGRIHLLRLVTRAVGHAHRRGILHRDLKPANILVQRKDGDHRPVLIDFGIAQSLAMQRDEERLTDVGQIVGTAGYMSPEQARGARYLDVRSDVYALGRVFGDLLLPTRSVRLRAIYRKATAPDPDQRYATAHDLSEDLDAILEGKPLRHAKFGGAVLLTWVRRTAAAWTCIAISIGTLLYGIDHARQWRNEQRAQERSATANARVAKAASSFLIDLETVHDIRGLNRRAESIWPLNTAHREALETWIDQAQRYRPLLERIREDTAAAAVVPPALMTFLEGELVDLLEHPGEDRSPSRHDLRGMEARLAHILALQETTRSPRVDEARRACLERLARPGAPYERSPLEVVPEDLIPLGCDPRSQLEEFGVFGTGKLPERRADGSLAREQNTCIILVLLPGGTFFRGAQSEHPAGRNYDPQGSDVPPTRSSVPPFFLSKFELTQAQWERMAGGNPSTYGTRDELLGVEEHALHPVESVSWSEANRVLRRFGLSVPDRIQWEYACRAGRSTPWYTGSTSATLEGAANLSDRSLIRVAGPTWNERIHPWDDGFPVHAPVGSFRPNAFGLYDMHGNVFEWLADGIEEFEEMRPEAGFEHAKREGARHRFVIGGSWREGALLTRAAYVSSMEPNQHESHVGVRPSRPIP